MTQVDKIMQIFKPYLNHSELDAMSEATGEDWEEELKEKIAAVLDD